MIVSVGTDVVEVARLGRSLERVAGLRERLFTEAEQGLPLPSLAARFAAKEAVAKVLGSPPGLGFQQAEVLRGEHGRPVLVVRGEAARVAASLGIDRWHVTLTHDAGVAMATVVGERREPREVHSSLPGPALHDLLAHYPRPVRSDHKYTRGVVGVAAGSQQYPGAAVLCTAGAQAVGVGMVRYAGPRRAEDLVLSRSPEVVPGVGRVQAWVLGPGTDPADEGRQAELAALAGQDVPVVLDAGALHLVESRTGRPTVITPHAGELAGLLGWERGRVEEDPQRAGREAAKRWGVTTLVKGADTWVVPSPQRWEEGARDARVDEGTSWLATAGTGDVLAGAVGGLLALGMEPDTAARLGAGLHGVAGRRASRGGPLRASQLPDEIRAVLGAGLSTA